MAPIEAKSADDFLAKWNLDEECASKLKELSSGTQEEVMSSFAPPAGVSNMNGLFLVFVNRRAQRARGRSESAGVSEKDLEAFAAKWSFSEEAMQKVTVLPGYLRKTVVFDFKPPEDVRDMVGVLSAFIRRLREQYPAEGDRRRAGRPPVMAANGAPPIGAGKGDAASGEPRVSEGSPKRNRSRVPSSVKSEPPSPEEFIARFSLDEASQDILQKLPEEVKATVMINFKPSVDTQDVNGRFQAYVKSASAGEGGRGGRPPLRGSAARAAPGGAVGTVEGAASKAGGKAAGKGNRSRSDDAGPKGKGKGSAKGAGKTPSKGGGGGIGSGDAGSRYIVRGRAASWLAAASRT